jgi:hypothetical protein
MSRLIDVSSMLPPGPAINIRFEVGPRVTVPVPDSILGSKTKLLFPHLVSDLICSLSTDVGYTVLCAFLRLKTSFSIFGKRATGALAHHARRHAVV